MQSRTTRAAWSCALILLTGSPRPAAATSVVPMGDADLVRQSAVIVAGWVQRIETVELRSARVVTQITLAVDQAVRESTRSETITFTEPGGEIGGRLVWLFAAPEFSVGEHVLVFLTRNARGELATTGLGLGAFRIAPGTRGVEWLEPKLGDQPRRRLASVLRGLAGLARQIPPPPSRPLAADQTADDPATARATVDRFTFISNPPGRWGEPDRGAPVRLLLANSDGKLGGSVSQHIIDEAFAAWTSVPSATIKLQAARGGSPAASIASGKCDGKSVIQFNDPQHEVPDLSSSCTGIVAVGGYCAETATTTVGGLSFRRIREGDIVVNERAGECFGEQNLAEVLTHETGHVIGLGHSSENVSEPDPVLRDATMFFLAHFDGRGASLRADDTAGVTAIYQSQDADGDGVADGLDQCPATPADLTVDATGCACADDGHASCDDGDACTIDACDANTAECTHQPLCADEDPCTANVCDASATCSYPPKTGTEAVTCVFKRTLRSGSCTHQRVAGIANRFAQIGRLVKRGMGTQSAEVLQARLSRASQRLAQLLPALDRAAARGVDGTCIDALRAIAVDAKSRVDAALPG